MPGDHKINLQTLADPIARCDEDGHILWANDAFMAQIAPGARAGQKFTDLVTPIKPPEEAAAVFESQHDGVNGPLWIEWRVDALENGQRLYSGRDITRRHQREQALVENAKSRQRFFASMTHELRTPLNGIIGMAQLLENSPLKKDQRAQLGAITESGTHLLHLINQILDYARLESEGAALEDNDVHLGALLRSVAELLAPPAQEKSLEIGVYLDPQLPTVIRADEARLRQIMFNLAGNAVKFTQSGGIILRAEKTAGEESGLRLGVADTGVGIPKQDQDKIFREFAQLDAGHDTRFGGTGLGLAIVKRLARAMKGEIGMHSRAGKGSDFWIDLPIIAGPDAHPHNDWTQVKGLKIIIAVDNPVLAKALGMQLGAAGAVVYEQADAAPLDADVLIAQSAAQAQKIPARGRLLLVEAGQSPASTPQILHGMNGWLTKPVRPDVLLARVGAAARGETIAEPKPEMVDKIAALQSVSGVKVLLAEDNPINALLARTMLTRLGCVVDLAGTGKQALSNAKENQYDLILMDMRMPEMDGLAAAQHIRALPGGCAKTPIIALTANASAHDRSACLDAGMDDFLVKPVDAQDLSACILRWTQDEKQTKLG